MATICIQTIGRQIFHNWEQNWYYIYNWSFENFVQISLLFLKIWTKPVFTLERDTVSMFGSIWGLRFPTQKLFVLMSIITSKYLYYRKIRYSLTTYYALSVWDNSKRLERFEADRRTRNMLISLSIFSNLCAC